MTRIGILQPSSDIQITRIKIIDGMRFAIPDKTDEPVDLQLSPGHSCPYKTGHPFLTISTNGMQDLAQANNDQSEHSSSWMTANGTLIVFQLPRTGSNQLPTDQITVFLNFGHATSCYKGSPQKCFKIIKNSSKSPIFKEICSYQWYFLERYGRSDYYEKS